LQLTACTPAPGGSLVDSPAANGHGRVAQFEEFVFLVVYVVVTQLSKVVLDCVCRPSSFVDGPNDERLASSAITSGEDA
jgi:hypothetical protein